MKNKALSLLLAGIMVLSFTSCSDGEPSTDVNDNGTQSVDHGANQNIPDNAEGYFDDAGNFWLKDGTGYYAVDGSFVSTGGGNDNTSTESQSFFPAEIIGSYGTASVQHIGFQDSLTIVENQITVKRNGSEIVYPSSAFTLVSNGDRFEYNYMGDSGDYGTLMVRTDFEGELYADFMIYTDSGETDEKLSLQNIHKTDVLYGIPLEGYKSLDGEGEFGAVPMTAEVRTALLDGVTDDYIIYGGGGSIGYPDGSVLKWDHYNITWYSEFGYAIGEREVNAFNNSDDMNKYWEESKARFEDNEVDKSGNIITVTFDKDDMPYYYTETKNYKLSEIEAVYGEHSFQNSNSSMKYYVSKPYSVDEGKALNAASELMVKMEADGAANDNSSASAYIFGNALHPIIKINNYDINIDINILKAEGDMLVGYSFSNYNGSDYADNTYVVELTLDGANVNIKHLTFDGVGQIDYNNYKSHTPTNEFTATFPVKNH